VTTRSDTIAESVQEALLTKLQLASDVPDKNNSTYPPAPYVSPTAAVAITN